MSVAAICVSDNVSASDPVFCQNNDMLHATHIEEWGILEIRGKLESRKSAASGGRDFKTPSKVRQLQLHVAKPFK